MQGFDPWLGKISDATVQFSSVAQSCPTFCDPMNQMPQGMVKKKKINLTSNTKKKKNTNWNKYILKRSYRFISLIMRSSVVEDAFYNEQRVMKTGIIFLEDTFKICIKNIKILHTLLSKISNILLSGNNSEIWKKLTKRSSLQYYLQ